MKRLLSSLKWLYPGMRVKRWLLLTLLGIGIVLAGVALALVSSLDYLQWLNNTADWIYIKTGLDPVRYPFLYLPFGLVIASLGVLLIYSSQIQLNRSVLMAVAPELPEDLADRIYQKRALAQGQRIVVIGGGTGLSTLLRGLKERTSNIVAIVTVTDNGGSSGRLTKQMGVLPPGDLRNCLVALADAEPTLAGLFQFRFDDDQEGLAGHNFGNLFIAAMTEMYKGNYEQAIAATSRVLAIRGKVYPSTVQNVTLLAEMEDGAVVEGETEIAHYPEPIQRMYLRPENAQPLTEAVEAIKLADVIILGPGSVFTSIVPNLLVEGIADTIAKSRAMKLYVCNVMTQPGETGGFAASEHVKALSQYGPERKLFTHVLVNTARPHADLLERYKQYGQTFVEPDTEAINALGYTVVPGQFISESDVVRHDSARLADAIFRIIL